MWKPVLFVAGLLLAALFLVVYHQVLYTVREEGRQYLRDHAERDHVRWCAGGD